MKTSFLNLTAIITKVTLLIVFSVAALWGAQFAQANDTSANQLIEAEQSQEVVNINQADADQLAAVLKGIGPRKAEAIITWREENGQFTTIDQLVQVKGIGEKTIEANRKRITL